MMQPCQGHMGLQRQAPTPCAQPACVPLRTLPVCVQHSKRAAHHMRAHHPTVRVRALLNSSMQTHAMHLTMLPSGSNDIKAIRSSSSSWQSLQSQPVLRQAANPSRCSVRAAVTRNGGSDGGDQADQAKKSNDPPPQSSGQDSSSSGSSTSGCSLAFMNEVELSCTICNSSWSSMRPFSLVFQSLLSLAKKQAG